MSLDQGGETVGTESAQTRRAAKDEDYNDVVLPTQYYAASSGVLAQPEKRLMAAVLEEAVALVLRDPRGVPCSPEMQEAGDWLASDDPGGPFAFVNICDTLGLEPASVRHAVDGLHAGAGKFVRPRISAGRGRHRISSNRRRSRKAA